MTKRDLFRLLLKVFGLYALVTSIFSLIRQAAYVLSYSDAISEFSIAGYMLLLIAMILLFFYLVFKPDILIDLLKLDRGFDDDVSASIKIDGHALMKTGIIIVAGLFLINNAADFAIILYAFIKNKIYNGGTQDFYDLTPKKTIADVVLVALNIIVGWLLITNVNTISKYLLNEKRNEE